MDLKKSKLEIVKNALQIAVMYAKTESYTNDLQHLFPAVLRMLKNDSVWSK